MLGSSFRQGLAESAPNWSTLGMVKGERRAIYLLIPNFTKSINLASTLDLDTFSVEEVCLLGHI